MRQLGNQHHQTGNEINRKQGTIVMRVVSTQQEPTRKGEKVSKSQQLFMSPHLQDDGESGQEFTIGGVLFTLIQLFPQGERVILVLIDVKGGPQNPVKEEEGGLAKRKFKEIKSSLLQSPHLQCYKSN